MNKKKYISPVFSTVAMTIESHIMKTSRYTGDHKVKDDDGDEEPDPLAKHHSAWENWDD